MNLLSAKLAFRKCLHYFVPRYYEHLWKKKRNIVTLYLPFNMDQEESTNHNEQNAEGKNFFNDPLLMSSSWKSHELAVNREKRWINSSDKVTFVFKALWWYSSKLKTKPNQTKPKKQNKTKQSKNKNKNKQKQKTKTKTKQKQKRKLDCSLILNLYRMYQSISSSNVQISWKINGRLCFIMLKYEEL